MKALKCSLRDFFWLTLLAAVLTAWGLDHRQSRLQIQRLTPPVVPKLPSGLLVSQTPPPLGGIITTIGAAGTAVEISLGKDDGLKPGNVSQVLRGRQRLGEIVISIAAMDRSVGELDKRLQRGRFRASDRVPGVVSKRRLAAQ
jgi:hypothetical protein